MRDAAWKLEAFVAEVNTRLERLLPGDGGDARQREDFSVRLLRHYSSLGLVDESERVGREALYRYRHLLQVLSLRQLQREGWNSKAIAGFTARSNAELENFLNGRDPAQQASYAQQIAQSPAGSSQRRGVRPLEEIAADAELERAEPEHDAFEHAAPVAAAAPLFEKAKRAASVPAVAAHPEGKLEVRAQESPSQSALEFLDRVRARSVAPQLPAPAPLPPFALHDPTPTAQPWQRVEIAPGLELHVAQTYRPARTSADKKKLLDAVETALERITQP